MCIYSFHITNESCIPSLFKKDNNSVIPHIRNHNLNMYGAFLAYSSNRSRFQGIHFNYCHGIASQQLFHLWTSFGAVMRSPGIHLSRCCCLCYAISDRQAYSYYCASSSVHTCTHSLNIPVGLRLYILLSASKKCLSAVFWDNFGNGNWNLVAYIGRLLLIQFGLLVKMEFILTNLMPIQAPHRSQYKHYKNHNINVRCFRNLIKIIYFKQTNNQ